jgi:hypothetical protein
MAPPHLTTMDFSLGTLALEQWNETTTDRVVLAFLAAEWEKFPSEIRMKLAHLVSASSLTDLGQNESRRYLLNCRRGLLLNEVPTDTTWFEVKHLRPMHLSQLHAINDPGWTSPNDFNELLKVAQRKAEPLTSPPSTWRQTILWGHTKAGPFTILEGNHRLVALAAAKPAMDFKLEVYIGLASGGCIWHLPDGIV